MSWHHAAGLGGAAEARYQPSEPYSLTAEQHGALLHPLGRRGHVAIATMIPGEGWRERAVKVSEVPEILPLYAGVSNAYMSVQRFWGWRRIARLAELGALAQDIDFRKVPKLRDSHPLGVLEDCWIALEDARKPQPSLAIASGGGLHLLWLHEPVSRGALPRWNACQKELWKVLKPFGADRAALDAARVLRLIGSQHSGSGLIVEALTPAGEVWEFDLLADEVLPHTRAEVIDFRIRRAKRDAGRRKRRQRRPMAAQGFNLGTLQEARLSDLQALVNHVRWFGELPAGQRDIWMFLAANAMSWLAPPECMEREAYALAREVCSWDDQETRARLQAVFKRARMFQRGETIEWQGEEIDPRYHFRTETIIEWLEITPQEQRQMRTLISPAEKARRRKEKHREAGGRSREEYESRAALRRSDARRMYSEGMSVEEIAKILRVSIHSVHSYVFR